MTNKKEKDTSIMDMLTSLINEVFSDHDKGKSEKPHAAPPVKEQPFNPLYESIEDYTAKTGKRFRMTKAQKELGLTRDEAFSEFTQIENDTLGELNR